MKQHVFFVFPLIIEGTGEKVLQFIMQLKVNLQQIFSWIEQKMYFWTIQRGSKNKKSTNWHNFCHAFFSDDLFRGAPYSIKQRFEVPLGNTYVGSLVSAGRKSNIFRSGHQPKNVEDLGDVGGNIFEQLPIRTSAAALDGDDVHVRTGNLATVLQNFCFPRQRRCTKIIFPWHFSGLWAYNALSRSLRVWLPKVIHSDRLQPMQIIPKESPSNLFVYPPLTYGALEMAPIYQV